MYIFRENISIDAINAVIRSNIETEEGSLYYQVDDSQVLTYNPEADEIWIYRNDKSTIK